MSGPLKINAWEKPSLEYILQRHDVTLTDLRSKSQKQRLVRVRVEVANYLHRAGKKPPEIADILNHDRTTIYHYLKDYQE